MKAQQGKEEHFKSSLPREINFLGPLKSNDNVYNSISLLRAWAWAQLVAGGKGEMRGRGKSAFKHAIKLENPPFLDAASCFDFAVYLIQTQQAQPYSKERCRRESDGEGRGGRCRGKRVSATKPHSFAASNRNRGSSS